MAFEARWKQGYRAKVSAGVAVTEIRSIEDRDGRVSPQALVDAARSQDAPLHRAFTWNNDEAAESWRVTEARRLMASLVVVEVLGDDSKELGPAFVSVEVVEADEEDLGRGYVSIAKVQADPGLSDQVLRQAVRGLRGWRKRYESLRALMPKVFEAMDVELGE